MFKTFLPYLSYLIGVLFYFRYLLKGGDEGRFEVEHASGNIKASSLLDDLIVPRVFTLEIEAHDKGLVRMVAKTIVKIKVVDKETPIFEQLTYSRVVREDVKVGEEITRVQARSPGGAAILYTIMAGDPLNQFAIDLKTGNCSPVYSKIQSTTKTNLILVRTINVINQSLLKAAKSRYFELFFGSFKIVVNWKETFK